jgi:hypothetical protein
MTSKIAKTAVPRTQEFVPFSWFSQAAQSGHGAKFVDLTRDVAHGIALIVDLVHVSVLQETNGELPTLALQAREDLMRLAASSANLLGQAAEEQCEALERAAHKNGGAA